MCDDEEEYGSELDDGSSDLCGEEYVRVPFILECSRC